MIQVKALGEEAMCLRMEDMKKLPKKGKTYRVFHDKLGLIGKAKTCLVEVENRDNEVFIADIETGSLYNQETMRCLTGDLELKP